MSYGKSYSGHYVADSGEAGGKTPAGMAASMKGKEGVGLRQTFKRTGRIAGMKAPGAKDSDPLVTIAQAPADVRKIKRFQGV